MGSYANPFPWIWVASAPPSFRDLFSKFWEFLKIHFSLLIVAPHKKFASAHPDCNQIFFCCSQKHIHVTYQIQFFVILLHQHLNVNNATIEVFRSGSRHSEEPEVFEGRTDASADISLFINERFMLDEMTQQIASKFPRPFHQV